MGYLEAAGAVSLPFGGRLATSLPSGPSPWRLPAADSAHQRPLLVVPWPRPGMGAGGARGASFTFTAVGLLATGVCRLRSHSQGLLAGMVLLGTKAFVTLGAAQYADVPLAFFILATVLLLGLDDASEHSSRGLLLLAGLLIFAKRSDNRVT